MPKRMESIGMKKLAIILLPSMSRGNPSPMLFEAFSLAGPSNTHVKQSFVDSGRTARS